MCRSSIEELAFVNLLMADALIKEMIPDEAAASEGLPDEDLLLNGRPYTEFHALGYHHGIRMTTVHLEPPDHGNLC